MWAQPQCLFSRQLLVVAPDLLVVGCLAGGQVPRLIRPEMLGMLGRQGSLAGPSRAPSGLPTRRIMSGPPTRDGLLPHKPHKGIAEGGLPRKPHKGIEAGGRGKARKLKTRMPSRYDQRA